MKKLILASASPRRAHMLGRLGVRFSLAPPSAEEPPHRRGIPPSSYVRKNAELKARSSARGAGSALVIGADTVVVYRGRVLGKPRTLHEAFEFLHLLNGRSHAVYTGLCIVDTGDMSALRGYDKTIVTFRKLSDEEIRQYLARINPLDKAGAYAIQGHGALLVSAIAGCYYNVVGFPVALLEQMLVQKGASLFSYMRKDVPGHVRRRQQ